MNIQNRERTTGGWNVTIEVPNAYTTGESRFDRVTIPDAAVRGKTPEQVRQAVFDAVNDDPIAQVLGKTVAQPSQAKAIREDRMLDLFADWQRWKATHAEAVARAVAANVITALLARTDAAWAAYVVAIQAWRAAAP